MPEPLRFPPVARHGFHANGTSYDPRQCNACYFGAATTEPEPTQPEPERGYCSTPDEAGELSCVAPVRWRISLPDRAEHWDVCHGHIGDALVNADDCYAAGSPVTVRYLG